jgi:hypothetical protein
MKRVAILTPSYDGSVSIEYSSSLANSAILLNNKGYTLDHIYVNGEAIVQSARNKLFFNAYHKDYDCVVWIDSDIEWNPKDLLKLVSSPLDVIGATYRRKAMKEMYVAKVSNLISGDVIEVDGIGFGFLKMSRKVIDSLWNTNDSYEDDKSLCKNVFEVIVEKGQMYSEDYVACKKIKDLGFNVYLDKTIDLSHTSKINLIGSFLNWEKQYLT